MLPTACVVVALVLVLVLLPVLVLVLGAERCMLHLGAGCWVLRAGCRVLGCSSSRAFARCAS